MNPTTLFQLCTALLLLLPTSGMAQPPLHFAPLPMENREIVFKQFEPLRLFLEKKTNRKIQFSFSDSYQELLDNFIAGKVDLAYLGPLPYVELRRKAPCAVPLVTFREAAGTAGYTCALITVPGSGFGTAAKQSFALTQPLSTCGYLSVSGLLAEKGVSLAQQRFRYLGKHDAVALATARREFTAGGVKSSIARKYAHLGLKTVAETGTLPGFALVINSNTVNSSLAATIQNALTSLQPEGSDAAMLAKWGKKLRNGTVKAEDKNYDLIRRYLQNITIAPTGNY